MIEMNKKDYKLIKELITFVSEDNCFRDCNNNNSDETIGDEDI